MTAAKLMTNISPLLYQFIDTTAKAEGKSKRQIIEEALALYINDKKRKKLADGYRKMAKDKNYLSEMSEIAELGMEYYLKDLNE